MTEMPPRQSLRQHLAGDTCIRPASVFDPASARIAESIGFEAGMYAGSVASLVVLGAPDIILLTLSEFAAQARRICRASSIPLICDADHGYGNALNVMRTVEELENAGVAGLTIEDTELPRSFGQARPRLLPLAEGLGKMRAGLAARQDPHLCIFARTSALNITGVADMQERLAAYQDTGVDGVFLTGVTKISDLDAIARVAKVPILLGAIGPEVDKSQLLAAHGVRVALLGHQPFMAAVEAVRACMQAQRDDAALPAQADKTLMQTVTRSVTYDGWTKDFLQP